MIVSWITRDGRSHQIRLGTVDYCLADLNGFQHFITLFQMCFAEGGGPWVPTDWMYRWLWELHSSLDAERDVLPFRPKILMELIADSDPSRAKKAMSAMMGMVKIDSEELGRAVGE